MESVDKELTKRPYQSPELVTYGDIRLITQTKDNVGNADGATMGTDKT
jgi:hypothetical protein